MFSRPRGIPLKSHSPNHAQPGTPASTVLLRDGPSGTDTLIEQIGPTGAGNTLVLLNGLLGQNRHWTQCVEHLAPQHRVVLLQPALLELTGPSCSVAGVVRIITEVLESVVGAPAVLAGNSLGGHVALRLALERPHLIRGLVLIGSSGLFERTLEKGVEHRPSREWMEKKIHGLFHDTASIPPTMVDEAYAEMCKRHSTRALVKLGRSAKNDHLGEMLHGITQPTLLAWGRNDLVTPPEVAEEFRSLIPGSKLEWIDRCGHAPQIERPAELAGLLSKFLGELGATPADAKQGRLSAGGRVKEVA